MNKYEYGATLAASLGYLVLRQQDALGCVAFDEKIRQKVPIRSKRNHLLAVCEALNISEPRDKTDMLAILSGVAESYPRRGMIVLVSDLLTDQEKLGKGLKMLRQRGHDVMVLHVLDDDELEFPFSGPTRFEGLESPDFLNCNPRALRDGYLEALNTWLAQIRRLCASNTIDYALIKTSDPLDAALATFVSRRLNSMSRK
jgi:uncharacterized protein (DUF58 family)